MLYTIGKRDAYLAGIQDLGAQFIKAGKRQSFHSKPYPGGTVFETEKSARDYLLNNSPRLDGYDVFKLIGVYWNDQDTEYAPGQPFRLLLKDAPIIALDKGGDAN